MSSEQLQTQTYSFRTDTANGSFSYSIRVDNLYSTINLYVQDISTPQGRYIENIPLPEVVVRDMVTSIDSILGINTPTITLDRLSLAFTAIEGGPNPATQKIVAGNTGDFGSLLQLVMTSNRTWIVPVPETVGNIAKDESTDIMVQAITSTLTAASSPYTGALAIAGTRASNTPQTVNVTFTVLPKATIHIDPVGTLTFVAHLGVSPLPQIVNVSNSGPATSLLNWVATKVDGSSWLTINPTSGGPMGSSDIPIVINVLIDATRIGVGSYIDVVRISDPLASNTPIEFEVRLSVLE
jgi:hypothetical protein